MLKSLVLVGLVTSFALSVFADDSFDTLSAGLVSAQVPDFSILGKQYFGVCYNNPAVNLPVNIPGTSQLLVDDGGCGFLITTVTDQNFALALAGPDQKLSFKDCKNGPPTYAQFADFMESFKQDNPQNGVVAGGSFEYTSPGYTDQFVARQDGDNIYYALIGGTYTIENPYTVCRANVNDYLK